jgi:hypothetical protein
MRSLDSVFEALSASPFRQRFRLGPKERGYLAGRASEDIAQHARRIVHERLGAAHPAKDGKQTPMRGHPVFIAQHATATCCRGCLAKWHGIARGAPLKEAEEQHAVAAIMRWLLLQPKEASEVVKGRGEQLKLALEFVK